LKEEGERKRKEQVDTRGMLIRKQSSPLFFLERGDGVRPEAKRAPIILTTFAFC
jgi:hypothetical protein